MKKISLLLIVMTSLLFAGARASAYAYQGSEPSDQKSQPVLTEHSMKDVFAGKFYLGTAVNSGQVSGRDLQGHQAAKKHFNSIVAENCMKPVAIEFEKGKFHFDSADAFVAFGETNKMFIVGHTLVWHESLPRWFYTDEKGKDVNREVLLGRMREYIQTVVGRYKGRVQGWDVVNEAILEDGSWRKTKFYEIIGEDYLAYAFQFAHEADPEAELYYNDYNMAAEGKRQAVVKLIHQFQQKGIRLDAVGMQGHLNMRYPSVEEFEKSILAFASAGVKVNITELDLSILPAPNYRVGADVSATAAYQEKMNPYPKGLPEDVSQKWNERMGAFIDLFEKHADKIERVTVWGVSDNSSWCNNWPIRGRTDYPLLLDRDYKMKQCIQKRFDKN